MNGSDVCVLCLVRRMEEGTSGWAGVFRLRRAVQPSQEYTKAPAPPTTSLTEGQVRQRDWSLGNRSRSLSAQIIKPGGTIRNELAPCVQWSQRLKHMSYTSVMKALVQ